LRGDCPAEVGAIFFGGRLIAISKKSGGIRPIAIGFTLRRLTSKCASAFGVSRLSSVFSPRQLGVGVPGGCEAAVHACRRYLNGMPSNHVVVKLDFANAFNSLHRDVMLSAIYSALPELYSYCSSAYGNSSVLHFGTFTILSEEGAQQGDPLGPLLFCTAIQPLIAGLSSDLTLGYLDDLTLGGPEQVVARDVDRIKQVGGSMGLHLNDAKCEVILHPNSTDSVFSQFVPVTLDNATLLGAPLFQGSGLDITWSNYCSDLSRAIDRLTVIAAHDALILLKACFSAPKVQYILRSSPSMDHPGLAVFDNLLRDGLERITNSSLSNAQYLQASLPIKDGGLGVRRVASLALPCFLASAASTLSLQERILESAYLQPDPYIDSYLASWSAVSGNSPPSAPFCHQQSSWDRPGIEKDKADLWLSFTNPVDQARFLAVSARHSGDWLHALPIKSCGLRLDDEAVRVAVGLRLGVRICVPHPCVCGSQVDALGIHCLSCRQVPGKIPRHQALNDTIFRALTTAGIPSSKEPAGLTRTDGKRPDGVTLIPWKQGKSLAWDVTVINTLADSYVSQSSASAGAAAELAASRKIEKYVELERTYFFQPVAFETLGPSCLSTVNFITELGHRLSRVSGDLRETSFLFQRISLALQRFNSVLVRNSFGQFADTE
jgi:hypothetical protein